MPLVASVSSVSGPIFGLGQVIGLQPGQTDSSDIVLNLQPGAVGYVAGSATLKFTDSDASGITALATGTVQVSGTFYRPASSTFRQTQFWAHVGETPSQPLSIQNAVPNDGFSEALIVTPVSGTGGFSASGATGDLGPTEFGFGIHVTFPTTQLGKIAGTLTFDRQSDGTGIDGLGVADLGNQTINVTANIN